MNNVTSGTTYTSDYDNYALGTVVVFGGKEEITISTQLADTRVAGAILFVTPEIEGRIEATIAITGNTDCRVVGKIEKGDLLITSSIRGVAVSSKTPVVGSVLGKALESYNSDHIGTIRISVGRA